MPVIAVVSNPNSRKNRRHSKERLARLRRIVGPWGEVCETHRLEELRPLVRRWVEKELGYLVCDGGDGSLHWAANELESALAARGSAQPMPPLLPTNGGTIDFVARKAGITGTAERILLKLTRQLARAEPPELVTLDTLEVTGIRREPDGSERPFRRIGFALAAGGIGQRFFDKYYEEKRPGAAAIARVVTRAVGSWVAGRIGLPLPERALRYGREIFRPTLAKVHIDGREVPGLEHGAIHAGSLDISLGGVFRVFPLAERSGALHFQAGGIVPREMIAALPDLYRGRAVCSTRLIECAGREMAVVATSEELLCPILDGERFEGLLSLTVRRGPSVRVPRVVA